MRKYEGSKADKKNDAKQAKKHGMSMRAWERSDMDRREDAKHQRAMDRKKRR